MRAARREDGVAMVEFALVLPLLALLVVTFLYVGVAMHAKIDGTHLTAEGARYITVNQNPGASQIPATSMQNFIRSRAGTLLLRAATVCISYPTNPETSTAGKVGDPVKVTMSQIYDTGPRLPDGRNLVPGTNQVVRSEATMRLEAPGAPDDIPAGCVT